ncbi:PA-domain containing subtilase family protein [Hibiscus syriacus]|uniref:O-fucosyltransferase family protein n=1 Tax=Hibiscus syriacus TaxID=106335 RepID=A0A6A2WJX2_HIBSY|nr:PA-domain containing subtilase family protein [Hibiscus syriacus]
MAGNCSCCFCLETHVLINVTGNLMGKNGYIMITADAGINQQRVACALHLLKPSPIVKEVPDELMSLDLEVTDVDVMKESKPSFYLKNIRPILLQKKVVHFVGFGNRLAFDPIPFQLQYQTRNNRATKPSRYQALHLRFEMDMVAHSLCEFGGGEEQRQELEAFRQIHFPALMELEKTGKLPSPAMLRSEGLCPLTPEEAVLMLAALGSLAAGPSRRNNYFGISSFHHAQVANASLDFIACTAADAFAMTDSGS